MYMCFWKEVPEKQIKPPKSPSVQIFPVLANKYYYAWQQICIFLWTALLFVFNIY